MATPTPLPLAAPRGRVTIDFARCTLDGACIEACPTPALTLRDDQRGTALLRLDLGSCVLCGRCVDACASGALQQSSEVELASRERAALVATGRYSAAAPLPAARVAKRVQERSRLRLGRDLRIRALDVGSCGGCEAEIDALTAPTATLRGLGMIIVDSPGHADLLLVSGTPTPAGAALLATVHAALPAGALVVALGACAIGGGVFASPQHPDPDAAPYPGVDATIPVDVYVPGCPPPPEAILHGILLALDRAPQKVKPESWSGAYPTR